MSTRIERLEARVGTLHVSLMPRRRGPDLACLSVEELELLDEFGRIAAAPEGDGYDLQRLSFEQQIALFELTDKVVLAQGA